MKDFLEIRDGAKKESVSFSLLAAKVRARGGSGRVSGRFGGEFGRIMAGFREHSAEILEGFSEKQGRDQERKCFFLAVCC